MTSLEGWSFTTKLHPQIQLQLTICDLIFTILLEIFNNKIEIIVFALKKMQKSKRIVKRRS
jgi:hypothetical protein